MFMYNFLLFLTIGLIALVSAAPLSEDGLELLDITLPNRNMTAEGYDPSFDYFDYSTIQIWMGKDKVSVGTMTGADLYKTVYALLDRRCSPNNNRDCNGVQFGTFTFTSRCIVHWPGGVENCDTDIWSVGAQWENDEVRKLLMAAVALSLEAVTTHEIQGPTNCYDVTGKKGCNVGDVVRVNFPNSPGSNRRNYMHITLSNGKTGYGNWDCCEGDTRQIMDRAADFIGPKIVDQFSQWKDRGFSRDSRCIINGWQSCLRSKTCPALA
ncbi:hypothetical protein HBH98_145100 [Parastagonospora nodorum]|nr:hypothetical protein HBI10_171910 [Parastagonospora nodorum]KAH4016210.1 hypothetical protein HBI13_154850 [Parastagonospora nodorum]KAH4100939.1 hypothetical protein HBH46_145890 [Parastagonospora nodorum]KAH4343641.1 hypothetical protein HBH98_145100 [Parastagonospora nodorum]KAH4371153.1 hypothetical protein HBH97_137480 [Parastagonospora nodorum]